MPCVQPLKNANDNQFIMIDHNTVQQILDTADIVDVVSDFVSLKRRGANWILDCVPSITTAALLFMSPEPRVSASALLVVKAVVQSISS